ncbi:MAG: hypothetical protein IKT46_03615 [Clostridia bacterium]|nr:hypothetical protein [Clostridia bacterium]
MEDKITDALEESDEIVAEEVVSVIEEQDADNVKQSAEYKEFEQKLADVGEDYDALVDFYNNIDTQLEPELYECCKEVAKTKLCEVQRSCLDAVISDAAAMACQEIRTAIAEADRYGFDEKILADAKLKLDKLLDISEHKVLSDFCSKIDTIGIPEIFEFRAMLESEGFKHENVSRYTSKINDRYWTIIYKESCAKCKQSVVHELVRDEVAANDLISCFEKCGVSPYKVAAYTTRVKNVFELRKEYDNVRTPIVNEIREKSLQFVGGIIEKDISSSSVSCIEPDIFICDDAAIRQHLVSDPFNSLYIDEEIPLLYMYRYGYDDNSTPVFSITNEAMYFPCEDEEQPYIRIPFENIGDIRAAVTTGEVYICYDDASVIIQTELPYKVRVLLGTAIRKIADYLIDSKRKNQTLLDSLRYEYDRNLALLFKKYPIPNDDIYSFEKPQSLIDLQTALESSEPWVCKCGKVNKGNFCSQCGTNKDEGIIEWTCDCGTVNRANFCTSCGGPRPQNDENEETVDIIE